MPTSQLPAHPREVRRMKIMQRTIIPVVLWLLALGVVFHDAGLAVRGWVQPLLGAAMIVMLGVTFHALYRFRKACIAWQNSDGAATGRPVEAG